MLTSLLREGGPNAFGYAPTAGAGSGSPQRSHSTTGKLDPKLKRRAIAAMGELIFYIAAQEDGPPPSGNGEEMPQDRWTLSSAAVSVLVRCLKDDSDECVRHYAAKVRKYNCHSTTSFHHLTTSPPSLSPPPLSIFPDIRLRIVS